MSKSFITIMTYKELLGKNVKVYRNLNNGRWSVSYKGRVVAHLEEIAIIPTKYHVNENGRQRVISKKRKEVHAWINGTVVKVENEHSGFEVSYDPYRYGHFFNNENYDIFESLNCKLFFNKYKKVYCFDEKL
ncbi:hypothetical protein [Halobacteriovorax sp. CON-3]|uniref:hypothetical protein n=1 Tax=Halobacteriovorax sp. CON-3 TaxID=3157710 RepID=UPI003719876C